MATSSFTNKWVAITGAAHGIGRELSRQLSKQGALLLLSDIDSKALHELAKELRKDNPNIFEWCIDVSNRHEMEHWVTEIKNHTLIVDILFNNAGVSVAASFTGHEWEDWERIIDINIYGVVYGCRLFYPLLQKSQHGRIVNMSSLFGIIAMPNQAAYCMSKYAVRGLSEALWEELDDVDVSVIHPGGVRTKIVEHSKSTSATYQEHLSTFFRTKTMKVETAVSLILDGVQKNKKRIVLTNEAILFDRVKRLFPVWGNSWSYQQIRKSMKLEKVEKFMRNSID